MDRFWMHQIYIMTESDREIEVIGVQQKLCESGGFVVQNFNRFAFIGAIKDVHISSNGKYADAMSS